MNQTDLTIRKERRFAVIPEHGVHSAAGRDLVRTRSTDDRIRAVCQGNLVRSAGSIVSALHAEQNAVIAEGHLAVVAQHRGLCVRVCTVDGNGV